MKTFISTKGYNETMHICVKIKILSCSGIYLNIPRFEDFFYFLKNLIYIEYNISINIHGKIMHNIKQQVQVQGQVQYLLNLSTQVFKYTSTSTRH